MASLFPIKDMFFHVQKWEQMAEVQGITPLHWSPCPEVSKLLNLSLENL